MDLFDLHCDTLYACYQTGARLRDNDLHIDRAAARRYGRYTQIFALFCGAQAPTDAQGWAARLAGLLATAQRELADNADWLTLCRSSAELDEAARAGKAAALLSIEGAELLPDRPDALAQVYAAGVRLITITWNHRNDFGCPAVLDQREGLTPAGRQLVRDCVAQGILVDVSHLSEQGFWDVCETTDAPFVASHSAARALCDHPRGLTDRQLTALAQRGGLVGVNLYAPFLVQRGRATIDDAIDHIEHLLERCGAHGVALGCDFDGCDALPDGIDGLGDLYRLADRMLARGHTDRTVRDLFYQNAAAFIHEML